MSLISSTLMIIYSVMTRIVGLSTVIKQTKTLTTVIEKSRIYISSITRALLLSIMMTKILIYMRTKTSLIRKIYRRTKKNLTRTIKRIIIWINPKSLNILTVLIIILKIHRLISIFPIETRCMKMPPSISMEISSLRFQ